MIRFLATVLWVILMAVVFIVAVIGGLLVKAAELMLPAVEALAEIGDRR
jgi:uncharacterized protein YhdP